MDQPSISVVVYVYKPNMCLPHVSYQQTCREINIILSIIHDLCVTFPGLLLTMHGYTAFAQSLMSLAWLHS